MKSRLDEITKHGKVVDHVCGSVLVHCKHGDGVPGDLLLRQQNCDTSEATKSRGRKSTAQLIQWSYE